MPATSQPAPARKWVWPNYCFTVTDILEAVGAGFELATCYSGQFNDRPRFALKRDGEFSPPSKVNQRAAATAVAKYLTVLVQLEDGTFLHKPAP